MDKWIVKIDTNPNYCGEGAGGAQFAHGQATIVDARMAAWFKAHKGYTVIKDEQPKDEQPKASKAGK